ncbi:Tetratricopeptide repeat protein 29 [Phlyctochytrium planicorne]|nr:Tetratricopeptide repeat protein 29 [Phlyctochytrium planicorne]
MVVKTGADHGESSLRQDDLQKLKKLLIAAELTQRTTDARSIYDSKKNIAAFFHHLDDSELAVKYYKEALDASKSIISSKETEVEASQNLAAVLEQYGRPSEALEYYEISRKLARDSGNVEGDTRSSKNIVHVRVKIAEQYLEEYLQKCQEDGNRSKEGPAQAALASCYETSGNLPSAIQHLQQFVTMTEDIPKQRQALAHACNQLGILYNKVGHYDLAVTFFDKHFSLIRTIASETAPPKTPQPHSLVTIVSKRQDSQKTDDGEKKAIEMSKEVHLKDSDSQPNPSSVIGLAQIQLGISRGNADLATFLNYVVEAPSKPSALQALLLWKQRRTFSDERPKREPNLFLDENAPSIDQPENASDTPHIEIAV